MVYIPDTRYYIKAYMNGTLYHTASHDGIELVSRRHYHIIFILLLCFFIILFMKEIGPLYFAYD